MLEERIKDGDTVLHFKGNKYQVITTDAFWHEDKTRLVIYRNLQTGKIYVRPYDMFTSEVDRVKYPNVQQKYRFEVVGNATPNSNNDNFPWWNYTNYNG